MRVSRGLSARLSGADSARSCRGVRCLDRVRALARSGAARSILPRDERQIGIEVSRSSRERKPSWCGYRGYGHLAMKIVPRRALASPEHVNAIGAIGPQKREWTNVAVTRADPIVVDSIEQAKDGSRRFDSVVCKMTRRVGCRARAWRDRAERSGKNRPNQITLFKSNGIATWTFAVAVRVFKLAVARAWDNPSALGRVKCGSSLRNSRSEEQDRVGVLVEWRATREHRDHAIS